MSRRDGYLGEVRRNNFQMIAAMFHQQKADTSFPTIPEPKNMDLLRAWIRWAYKLFVQAAVMKWHIMNADGLKSLDSGLGSHLGDNYIIAEECEETLQEILAKLQSEDEFILNTRCQPIVLKILKEDMVTILKTQEASLSVLTSVLRVLVNLTQPLEEDVPDHVTRLLGDVRAVFCDRELLLAVFQQMQPSIEKASAEQGEDKQLVSQVLLLLRNLLYINPDDGESDDTQPTLIQYLFSCGLDNILLSLLTSQSAVCWSAIIVQILSILYTDQNILNQLQGVDQTPVFCGTNESSGEFSNKSELAMTILNIDKSGWASLYTKEKKGEELVSLLKSFNSRFLVSGFSGLICNLKDVLLSRECCSINITYFMWAVMFFVRMARKEKVNFTHIKDVLNTSVFGFLVFEAVDICETLVLMERKQQNVTGQLRRLHFTVVAIKELLITLKMYDDCPDMNMENRTCIEQLKRSLANMCDLRQLFLLLIRHKHKNVLLLQDLILTNHMFLLLLDGWTKEQGNENEFDMLQHIRQFGTVGIMQHYGQLLENYQHNSRYTNECVITMMYHIAGDCKNPEVLMQASILKLFSKLHEENIVMSNEASDLIEYIIHKFLSLAADPFLCAKYLYRMELDCLGISMDKLAAEDTEHLLLNNVTSLSQEAWQMLLADDKVVEEQMEENKPEDTELTMNDDEIIEHCIKKLKEDGFSYQLSWLQTVLLETCFIKVVGCSYTSEKCQVEEPIPLYYILQNKSVPLVPYSKKHEEALENKQFDLLLKYIGFHTAGDVDRVYPRIPHFWTPDQLLSKALKLGPIKTEKFSPIDIADASEWKFEKFNQMKFVNVIPQDWTENNTYDCTGWQRWIEQMTLGQSMETSQATAVQV